MRMINADALENDIRKWIKIKDLNYEYGKAVGLEIALKCVAEAPTIEPEPKKGKWIDKSNGIEGAWNYCSVCGEQAIDLYDFCPNCGADMREGETDG